MANAFVLFSLLTMFHVIDVTADPPALTDVARIHIEPVNPWSHLDFHNDEANFQFAIVTDRTGGHRGTVFEDGLSKVNLLEPEFVMSVGDLIEGYSHDPVAIASQWDEFETFVDRLDMPFFYLPGNHDIQNQVMAQVWKERFGPSYYHFVYRDVLFLCLNTEDGKRGNISEAQIEYAQRALAENEDVRWTLVFLHQPLWVYTDDDGELRDTGWAGIEALIRDRQHTVFAGHFHSYFKYVRNEQNYFILATAGGVSGMRGPLYGEFDHAVWVTMMDDGPKVTNLMLDGIWDEDIRTEEIVAYTRPLLSGDAIAIPPLFLEAGNELTAAAMTLRLKNDADVPVAISGHFASHPTVAVSPESLELVMPPNSMEIVDLSASAASGGALREHEAVNFDWSATYEQEEVALPEIAGTVPLMVISLSPSVGISHTGSSIVVDGKLSDWADLPVVVKVAPDIRSSDLWEGPDDCSWRFGVTRDDQFIYVGIEVLDDNLEPQKEKKYPWEQDGVELHFDARPDPIRSLSRERSTFEMETTIKVWMAPGNTPEEIFVRAAERLEELGVRVAGLFTESGHTCEVAIPIEYVEERQGKDWDKVRINVTVEDVDGLDTLCQLWWPPEWRGSASFPGSGTFVRK